MYIGYQVPSATPWFDHLTQLSGKVERTTLAVRGWCARQGGEDFNRELLLLIVCIGRSWPDVSYCGCPAAPDTCMAPVQHLTLAFWPCLSHCYRRRMKRVPAPRKGRLSTLDRSVQAQNRVVRTNVFELPTPTTSPAATAPTSFHTDTTSPSFGASTTYSVCTSVSALRVAVIKAGDVYMCSRKRCRR